MNIGGQQSYGRPDFCIRAGNVFSRFHPERASKIVLESVYGKEFTYGYLMLNLLLFWMCVLWVSLNYLGK